MAPILEILPSELVAKVFAFIPERKEIANARLVCKTFHELSSPYLITSVTFALRLDTITRLREVVDHPYFSRYVTDLVHDASQYAGDLATNWNGYVSRCEDATRDLVDPEWLDRKRHDNSIIRELNNIDPEPEPTRCARHAIGDDDIDDAMDFTGMGRYYEQVYRYGCQRTFPDYYLRYRAQRTIEEKDLRDKLLKHMFAKLPKLRNVHFTDYRSLIRDGETYDALCSRLFGLTLEPEHLGQIREALPIWKAAFAVFQAAAEVPNARIESFKIGPHPFATPWAIIDSEVAQIDYPAMMPIFVLSRLQEPLFEATLQGFANLRKLELSFNDPLELDKCGDAALVKLLAAAAPSLSSLSLQRAVDRSDVDRELDPFGGATIDYEFLSIDFPQLKHFGLHYFQFLSEKPLLDFCSRHSATLKELCLVDCLPSDEESRYAQFGEWCRDNMQLTGVEAVHIRDLRALQPAFHARTRDRDVDRLILFDWYREAGDAASKIQERESVFLQGRPNTIKRTIDITMPDFDGPDDERDFLKWWQRPVRHGTAYI